MEQSLSLSLFDRTIARPRSPAFMVGLGVGLLALPFIAVWLDGVWVAISRQGLWRNIMVQPIVIFYVLLVTPVLARMGNEVVTSFRPLVPLDDVSYNSLVEHASAIPKWHEILAITIGVLFGLQSVAWGFNNDQTRWLFIYWVVSTCVMYGLLSWIIYVSFASTRLTVALHRQLKQLDLFDLTPFQAIGKQSLFLALVFVGGIVLSLVFGAQLENLLAIEFWIIYIPMGLVPVLVFFFNMQPTHRVLSSEKKRRLEKVQQRILHQMRSIEDHIDSSGQLEKSALQFNALLAYEQRLQAARTWPYNTAQLRTLFFSILFPAATMLLKLFVENFLI